jgi:hypothetical protein
VIAFVPAVLLMMFVGGMYAGRLSALSRLDEAQREVMCLEALVYEEEHMRYDDENLDDMIMGLGMRLGFGNLMHRASRCWARWNLRKGLSDGAHHTIGPCLATLRARGFDDTNELIEAWDALKPEVQEQARAVAERVRNAAETP